MSIGEDTKHTSAVEPFGIDWTDALTSLGFTSADITASEWVLPTFLDDETLAKTHEDLTAGVHRIWFKAGVPGRRHLITSRITLPPPSAGVDAVELYRSFDLTILPA